MATAFDKQIGAAGDVRELEYISALHQTTTEEVRKDASIKAEDIQRFLMSRYGIKVTPEEVSETILQGLGGGSDQDDVLDLMEVVAMLLIPIFLKAARKDYLTDHEKTENEHIDGDEEKEDTMEQPANMFSDAHTTPPPDDGLVPTPPGLLDFVLKMILHDVTGDKTPKRLTPNLIRRILISHGENDLANHDELVEEMFEAATSFDATTKSHEKESMNLMLDVETFAIALTHDVQLYDIRNETRLTTNFSDVYLTDENLAEQEHEMFETVSTNEELIRRHRENQAIRAKVQMADKIERVNTVPFIDTTAGTYRSKGLLVSLWATILITYFAYSDFSFENTCADELEYTFNSPWTDNMEAIVCESIVSIIRWMWFFFGFSLFGLICVYLGSVGNAVECKVAWRPMLSFTFTLLLVAIPFFVVDRNRDRRENTVLYVASLVFGLVTCAFCLARAAELYFSGAQMEEFKSWLPKPEHPLLKSTVSEERSVKQATARKLSEMTRNALKINKLKTPDSILNTHYGQALKSYETESRNPDNIVSAGGFFWSWKKLLGRKGHFAREGIWVPARMISGNLAQYVVACYVLLGGIFLTLHLEDEYTVEWAKRQFGDYIDRHIGVEADDELVYETVANLTSVFGGYLGEAEVNGEVDLGCSSFDTSPEDFVAMYCSDINGRLVCDQAPDMNYFCVLTNSEALQSLNATARLALLNTSAFPFTLLRGTVAGIATEAANDSLDTLYPAEKYMVTVPMYIATVIAFLVAAFLAIVYVPSVTTTILRLRSGNIATLRNKDFNRFRCAPDQVALLTGSLFWGSLFSSVLVGGSIGLIVFFFLWQASVYYAQRLVAILAGIISVALLRLAIVCTCRKCLWTSFYRVRPGAANISILALEWGNFALSAGYILARCLKLLLAASTFIGRIDTPFLAHNVGRIGPVELDNYPIVHMKDVLTHEAHRHPYIEQLGVIYLMKLRYKKHFGKRAGTAWRMIFVYALMPWLHRYRIMARHGQKTGKKDEDQVGKSLLNLNFVSLQHIDVTTGADDDVDQAHAEAMWMMKANSMLGLGENFYKIRNQELEEEVESLRVSLAEARSMRNEDLEEEIRRLRAALGEASSRPEQNKNVYYTEDVAPQPQYDHTRSESCHDPPGQPPRKAGGSPLAALQPIAPPQMDELPTSYSWLSNDSLNV